MLAMSVQPPIRRSMARQRQLLLATRTTAARFRISLASVCRGALAKENPIRDLCTRMEHTLVGLHPKLMFSNHRCGRPFLILIGFSTTVGHSSRSSLSICAVGCKWTVFSKCPDSHYEQPMNYAYQWSNLSQNYNIPNPDVTQLNSYLGGVYQQSTSGVTNTSKSDLTCNRSDANQILDQNCYTQKTGCFSTYGYQYKPGIYCFWYFKRVNTVIRLLS